MQAITKKTNVTHEQRPLTRLEVAEGILGEATDDLVTVLWCEVTEEGSCDFTKKLATVLYAVTQARKEIERACITLATEAKS